jgi:hypothetical protein
LHRKNRHKQKDQEIAINNLNPSSQERNGNEQGGDYLVFGTGIADRPSKKHHDQGSPDTRKKNGQQAMNR